MDEETNKIREHIDYEREQLGRDLDEIESRVKSATDLKAHFNKNTGLILGAAVAGGFLLSLACRNSSPSSSATTPWESNPRERVANTSTTQFKSSASLHLQRVSETLDDIFEGLVGVVTDKVYSFVADAVPGFRAQYDAIERQRNRSSVHQMKPNFATESEFSVK